MPDSNAPLPTQSLLLSDALTRYLRIFPGIGARTEEALKRRGISNWVDLQASLPPSLFPTSLEASVAGALDALDRRDALYFTSRLPARLRYLACLAFPEKVTYLDIESTGLSKVYHAITIVGWETGGRYTYDLVGRHGTPSVGFTEDLRQAPLVVTFNGSLFDIPFISSVTQLPEIASVDLRFLAYRLRLNGTLKQLEPRLGIERPAAVKATYGEKAPALWFRATRGDREALRELVRYNYYDVTSLHTVLHRLAERAVDEDLGTIDIRHGDPPKRPEEPTLATEEISLGIARIAKDGHPLLRFSDRYSPSREISIAGIDLTGSPAKPSGVAIITGRRVECWMINSDEDMLDLLRSRRPAIVSIDAPLSLPAGRLSVDDSDPTRSSAGILRWAERELLRRGVKLYACLLPSMQSLTARGVSLAERIRAEGIACIESFPGAAQDILAMPRKGVGVAHLKRSTEELGLELPSRDLTHDELDAVTSAVVGALFLDGRYEALGTPEEAPMIVPQLQRTVARNAMAVVFSGRIGAGKTTAARMLEAQGFTYARYSQVIFKAEGDPEASYSRADLQREGGAIHDQGAQRLLGERLLELLGDSTRVVIDGARWREDVAFIREHFGVGVLHVHIDAHRSVRRSRYANGAREFDRAESHPVESGVDGLGAIADRRIVNESDITTLRKALLDATSETEAFQVRIFEAAEREPAPRITN